MVPLSITVLDIGFEANGNRYVSTSVPRSCGHQLRVVLRSFKAHVSTQERNSVSLYESKPRNTAKRGYKFKLFRSRIEFRFCDGSFRSLGALPIRIPTPDRFFIEQRFDVVNEDTPMFLGLDLMDPASMYADNVDNKLVNKTLQDSMPIVRKLGHMYFKWPSA